MRAHGYSSIELSTDDKLSTDDTKRLLEDAGIKCCGVVAPPVEHSLVSSDPELRTLALHTAKQAADVAAELGGSELTLVPAAIGKLEPEGSAKDEWRFAIAGLRELTKYADDVGVKVAIEPLARFETYFINRAAQALALAEEVGPKCGICLDAFHMNIEEEDLADAIHSVGERLCAFHVADSNRLGCGMGHLDWTRIVSALQRINYDGALSLECVPTVDRTSGAGADTDDKWDPSPTASALSECMAQNARTLEPLIKRVSQPTPITEH